MPIFQDIALLLLKFGMGLIATGSVLGLYYSIKSQKERPFRGGYKEASVVQMLPVLLGSMIAVGAWFLTAVMHPEVTFALEGVELVLPLEYESVLIRWYLFTPILGALISITGFFFLRYKSKKTWQRYEWFYIFCLLTCVLFVATPAILFRDLYGALLTIEVLSDILIIGSAVMALFLYLRARIEKRAIGELLEGLKIVRRLFWFGLFAGYVLVISQWNESLFYSETFAYSQVLVAVMVMFAVIVFELILPYITSKNISWSKQGLATTAFSLLAGSALFTLLYSEIERLYIPMDIVTAIIVVSMLLILAVSLIVEWTLRKKGHSLW